MRQPRNGAQRNDGTRKKPICQPLCAPVYSRHMTENDIAISIENVVKEYSDTKAVQGISFQINKGDFFGFLGPNGAGKTTTINMLTGLANLTSGHIKVFGYDVVSQYQQTRPLIGLAAQEPNFDPFFPLDKVLVFQAGYHGMKRPEAKRRAEELLKRFDLWEHRKKTTRMISGGMKRRLLIAKALVHDPEILVLDEPTAGVDVELRRDLWRFLEDLNKKDGKTILLTTHYIEEAEYLCNRIGIINNGQMKAVEDKAVLMEQLAEKQVIFEAEAVSEVQQSALTAAGFKVSDTSISFETEDISQNVAALSGVLQEQGITIVDVNVNAFDLEDIFVQLTDIK